MSMLEMHKSHKKGRGKECGMMLIGHEQCRDVLPPITPLDTNKPAFAHLRNNGMRYIGLARSTTEAGGAKNK